MRNAFTAGTIAAITAGIVGYFLVIRHLAFAGHALSHISFTGAAGAGLIGLSPFAGQLILTSLAAIGMGSLGENINKSDTAIGVVLAFSLGLGMLFLHFYTSYAGQATAILFGDLLGVSQAIIQQMLIFSLFSIGALAIIARPLLFASLEPELAEGKGVPLKMLASLFLLIVAIAVAQASQVVGVLLVFTLLIGPAAAALQWTKTVCCGLILSILFALIIVWAGLLLAYATDWPTAFWISSLSLGFYLLSMTKHYLRR